MSTIRKITINEQWLVHDELHLCLVQTAPPTIGEIQTDSVRLGNVSLVQYLLNGSQGICNGSPILTELLPGSGPCVVMMPEYAFGSSDWGALDTAIRTVRRPLVFLAGFGATQGSVIRMWSSASHSGSEAPQCSEQLESLANSSPYNGAWCWVHIPDRHTTCYCFLKTFFEQSVECVAIPNLVSGSVQLLLEFNDLVIAPGICADLLCDQSDSWRTTLIRSLADQTRQVLIAGLLFQNGPGHALWQNAISNILNIPLGGSGCHPIVALVNHATGKPMGPETVDQWRSQSGVFSASSIFLTQEHLPNVRKVIDRSFLGVLIRHSEPCAVSGKVRWSCGSTTGKFLWHAGHRAVMDTTSQNFVLITNETGDSYECERFLMRLVLPIIHTETPPITALTAEREQLQNFIVGANKGPNFFASLLFGFAVNDHAGTPSSKVLCGYIKKPCCTDKLSRGLVGLLFLRHISIGDWSVENELGQMHGDIASKHVHTLVWCSAELNGRMMSRQIESWVDGLSAAPVLLVIGHPESGTLASGRVCPGSRHDIAQADGLAVSRRESCAEAAADIRVAYVLHLDEIVDYYPWQNDHKPDAQRYINEFIQTR